MTMRWHYTGDVDPEYGGAFYRLDGWQHGYFDVIRITPCSDAGGPNNLFWIECLVGIVPRDQAELDRVLDTACGLPASLDTLSEAERRHVVAKAALDYGLYDPANTAPYAQAETVQIGPDQYDGCGVFRGDLLRPTVRLRTGSRIERFARRPMMRRM